jgi:hypothetical protein
MSFPNYFDGCNSFIALMRIQKPALIERAKSDILFNEGED